ncbi:MAG: adenylosuccinate lyase [Candidatus Marinimicrobia bacterium]|jgi:adenylosuccinate lyase|nr:adenylosuccinate lyase [Candidatus Neomarinimicrobiota bacterium]|tara:strand:- start:13977 stop:15326 length:1350 start_codon:yes stop_codon:yes gene_type:complete
MSAISPLDGRYKKNVSELNNFFSEQALMKFRLEVEVKYLIALSEHRSLKKDLSLKKKEQKLLHSFYQNFDQKEYNAVKRVEAKTKHDVNAVVEYLTQKLEKNGFSKWTPFIHFGLTSEDINNTSYSLMFQRGVDESLLESLDQLSSLLVLLVGKTKDMPMLSLTHGQPATTTTLGKEMAVFHSRLERQITFIKKHSLLAKFSGATGTFAAHKIAFPKESWTVFSEKFIRSLGLKNNPITTQIEPNDSMAELLHAFVRINNILTDMCVDVWLYISRNIFTQINKPGEVGSSTMPHKINPISFENAEGNLELSNASFVFLASRLSRSRLQRDLSGSTLFRNIGVAFGHSLLAYKNIINGLNRIQPNKDQLSSELENQWSILAEAVQTILRKSGDKKAYTKIKKLTRGVPLNQETYLSLVESLDISEKDKKTLLSLTPSTYIGEIKKILRRY